VKRVPAGEGRAELHDRGSRFLALVFRVGDEAAFSERLKVIRAEHPKATHWCWAWRFCGFHRYSDDGEPGGTAGRPLLQALESAGLEDAAVVCVRWFGGTKLGKGGLVRAYGAAGVQAVEDAGALNLADRVAFHLELPFAKLGVRDEIEARFPSARFTGDFTESGFQGTLEVDETEVASLQSILSDKKVSARPS
jgi:uncharacterized YigZ family protein